MKTARHFVFSMILFFLVGCGGAPEEPEQPTAPWTYPILGYREIKTWAARPSEKEITRLVGWDEDYYYFDWNQQNTSISRGTGKVERPQFDLENSGALTLEKGLVTVSGGQVRTLQLR